MQKRKGFTLIELLVVIAIIGILAAMLFPVFARARESARKTQCLSNVKNIAMAVQMYLADYDRFPPKHEDANLRPWLDENNASGHARCNTGNSGDRFDGANPFLRWPVVLDEYIKNRDVWRCASSRGTDGATWIVPDYTSPWWVYLQQHTDAWGPGWTCHGDTACLGPCMRAWPPGWGGSVTDSLVQYQWALGDPKAFQAQIGANDVCLKGRSTSELDDPAAWVVCADNVGADLQLHQMFNAAYGSPDQFDLSCPEETARYWTEASYRKQFAPHLGGVNIGFADGHAKWWDAEAAVDNAGGCQCCFPIGNNSCDGWVRHPQHIKGMCPDYEVIN